MPNLIGYAFNGTQECQNVYIQYFIGATLTNITTWKSNSNEGRNTNNILKRKSFSSALPDVEKNQKEGN